MSRIESVGLARQLAAANPLKGSPSASFAPIAAINQTLEEAFPKVDPNYLPLGSLVLMQIRVAKRTVGKSNFVLPDEVIATIQANTQVAKVLSYGPLAFKNRNTGQEWPEGAWVKRGDYVRVPKFGGAERFEVPYGDGVVQFIVQKDLELGGIVPDPLAAIAFV
jgi:co-chaperonin GroES (HSP10)